MNDEKKKCPACSRNSLIHAGLKEICLRQAKCGYERKKQSIQITITGTQPGIGKTTVGRIIGYALQRQGIKVSMNDTSDYPGQTHSPAIEEFTKIEVPYVDRTRHVHIQIEESTATMEKELEKTA